MICQFQSCECKFKKFNEYYELFYCALKDKVGECPYNPDIRTIYAQPIQNKKNKEQTTLI